MKRLLQQFQVHLRSGLTEHENKTQLTRRAQHDVRGVSHEPIGAVGPKQETNKNLSHQGGHDFQAFLTKHVAHNVETDEKTKSLKTKPATLLLSAPL